ncbi:MAG TPA: HsdR family type I site-specific deoxyribonuclease [Acetivibrio sp.]|uniref:type I restriction endonuclease subunit R n=1 Tax=Acetivibrio sp. TaxID=1872092 RepID=UPI002BBEB0CF|nr:HsdR family type I site-specific deoxyribonuclease [Acetivibrio sp.]HOM03374.1 HsdR family type I site-specific deoxyribonuclease [Acetivibrio sp.]
MSKLGDEKHSVQKPIIDYVLEPSAEYIALNGTRVFLKLGWEYIGPDEALRLRGGETGMVFRELFINQLQKLNPEFADHLMAEEIIKKIESIPANIEGNFTAWEYLKGLKTVFVPSEKRERNIKLLDTEDVDRNTFHVTEEFMFTNGIKTIRQDIVFLINGIPLLFIETKAASKVEGMSEALEQIKRYHRDCPELLAVLQAYAITHISKYYYSGTWNTSEKLLFNWKEEAGGNFEQLVKSFFDRKRIIKLIMDYLLFTRQDDELKKVVLRPHQMRAVDKIVERAKDPEKHRGLVWHTQGSGKTYSMIVAAQKIIENPLFENPTVIMLVDRNELESQLFANIIAVGIGNVEVTESKEDLRKLLSHDRRGLIVTMIHKFDGMQANINTRKNIFVLVDEAHRTTGGKLGNYLMGALPNATYIGFTGTPIDKTRYGKGTFVTFGKDDPPQGYLDKYSIAESIEDGTTVPLYYTLAPNELRVEKEILEKEFFNLAETEGITDIEALNKVLEKAVTLRNMLKNKERVERVAFYIADHYKKFIEPMGYKAFVVGVDREACTLYKKELDRHLPPEYSKVVYSSSFKDPEELIKYQLSETEEKQIRKAFRKSNELPKILIVTEKLLTGFDAPILYCMYLDKPMRDHVLLQAIARVNRPYEDDEGRKKSSGFVLDFVAIFDNLEKALAFDSQDIEGVVHDMAVLKEQFKNEMQIAEKQYLPLIAGKHQDKAVEAVLEHFRDENKRQEFYRYFKQLSQLYEIISPDDFLRPYLDDYETLLRMYRIVRENYDRGISIDRDFTRKTAMLVQRHTTGSAIEATLDICEINEKTLKRIEESKASDTEKVFNLIKSIEKTAEQLSNKSPYLVSIAEKAEHLVKLFEERQQSTKETLEKLKEIIKEINTAQKEQAEKAMSSEIFTVYWMLKEQGISNAETLANGLQEVFTTYPHWHKSERFEREIRQSLYKALTQAGIQDTKRVSGIVQNIINILKKGQAE